MDKIIGVIGAIPISKTRNDDTSADRLSHRFTTGILIVFAAVVSAKQVSEKKQTKLIKSQIFNCLFCIFER